MTRARPAGGHERPVNPLLYNDVVRPDVVDPACSEHIPVSTLMHHQALPVCRTTDGVLVLTAIDAAEPSSIEDWFPGEALRYHRVAPGLVQELIVATRTDEVAEEMANGLARRRPDLSARTGVAGWQKTAAWAFVVGAVITLMAGGAPLIATMAGVVFVTGMLFKLVMAIASARPPVTTPPRQLTDEELPSYTILVPAYQEEAVIGETVRCIANLDYPNDKLEVLVLVERRDEATARAVRDVDPPEYVRIVTLPPGRPQTKPRSCNLGLMLARGDLLVIYDAEDRPDRDQLRKAASQFAAGGPGLACVQARLNFYNARRNLLTRMFALEFAYWFDLMLVGLDRLRLPIPLGGTSNHLRTDVLRDIGGWDAWNVTEDADIGVRLAAAGHRVEVVDSTTWEECPSGPWAWTRQRTRWLKGYLLTLLVHTRSPLAATRRFGVAGMVTLVGLVGGTPVSALLWPLALALPFAGAVGADPGSWSVVSAYASSGAMWIVVAMTAVATMVAGRRRGSGWTLAALLPCYLLMHAVAAWRGLLQLVRDPYSWEKTTHHEGAPNRSTTTAVPSRSWSTPRTSTDMDAGR